MSVTGEDIFRLIGFMQDDLRGVQAKLVELRTLLATVELPTENTFVVCPVSHCGVGIKSQRLLDEHLENVHGVIDGEQSV